MSRRITQLRNGLVALSFSLALTLGGLAGVASAASCMATAPTTATGHEQMLKQPIDGKWYRADYGQSVLLPGGKYLYVFGDTIIGPDGASRANHAVHNSAILVSGACASALVGPADAAGKPTDWIKVPTALDVPNQADYYWASTPYMDGKSTLRMFLLHEYNDESGFHSIGSDIATFSFNSKGVPVLKSVKPTPSSRAVQAPVWGAAVLRDGSYTYIYGSRYKGEYLTFGHHYYVARVANSSDETNQTNWRFWNGATWTKDQASAVEIISGVNGPGTNATVFKKGTTYVMIAKVNDALGSTLNYWTSPSPMGPWQVGASPLIQPIPGVNTSAQEYTYLGLAHPQQILSSGKVLVSWSLNSRDPSFFGDPRYGVYFSEVTIPVTSTSSP